MAVNNPKMTTRIQMQFEMEYNTATEDRWIKIRVPRGYFLSSKCARHDCSSMIDERQFFGMLEDVVCMKFGVEPPRSDERGYNVET